MKRILSGVQPTGNLHLGNYLGAIKQWVSLQNDYDCLFMLADLHAITVHQEPQALRDSVLRTTALYIACGIDAEKSAILNQSRVSGHAELGWILGCNTPIGWLNRMTQFKDKAGKDKEKAPLGLYSYPVLMAADILLYNADLVPVGDDQKQHLELARDIAAAFNRNYASELDNKGYFTVPEPMILKTAARVMSLKDGTKKMSKSDPSEQSRINLTDDADTIAKKVRKAQTDTETGISYDVANRPAVANLLSIYAALEGTTAEAAATKFAELNFSNFKEAIAASIIDKISPIKQRFEQLMKDKIYLMSVLSNGEERANTIAEHNLKQVKKIVGFL